MSGRGGDFLDALPRFAPRCYRCGVPLVAPRGDACPACAEATRPKLAAALLRLLRFRLWVLMVLVAVAAVASAWVVRERLHRLADDRGRFYSFEEEAVYQSFLESVFRQAARDAERKAAQGGPDAARWAREAAEARRRVAHAAKSRRELEWRASLKRAGW